MVPGLRPGRVPGTQRGQTVTLREAIDAFLRDGAARRLSTATLRGYRHALNHFEAFARERGLQRIESVDTALVRQWRETVPGSAGTCALRLQQVKTWLRFAEGAGWIAKSPAGRLRPPKRESPPTMPLTRAEVRAMLEATRDKPKERALALLMRYSGLAISDSVGLEKSALDGSLLTLRRAKSGELVFGSLPAPVTDALAAIDRPDRAHYFWTGRSTLKTVASYWRDRLHRVASQAGVANFRPHRLRDTFAVELLLAGVAIQDASALLEHSSVETTEKYYAPWDAARRDRLVAILRSAQGKDPLLLELAAASANKGGGCLYQTPPDARQHHLANAERALPI